MTEINVSQLESTIEKLKQECFQMTLLFDSEDTSLELSYWGGAIDAYGRVQDILTELKHKRQQPPYKNKGDT